MSSEASKKIRTAVQRIKLSGSLGPIEHRRVEDAKIHLKGERDRNYQLFVGELLSEGGPGGMMACVAALGRKNIMAKRDRQELLDTAKIFKDDTILALLAGKFGIPVSPKVIIQQHADVGKFDPGVEEQDAIKQAEDGKEDVFGTGDKGVQTDDPIMYKGPIELKALAEFLHWYPSMFPHAVELHMELPFKGQPTIRLDENMCQWFFWHAREGHGTSVNMGG